jgi:di/tricarboxylate transporter
LTIEIVAVLLLTLAAAFMFVTEVFRVDVVAIVVLVALALFGLVSPEQALSGFSNPATATVAAMFILSEALRVTGVVDGLAAVLGATVGRWLPLLYLALLAAAAAVSAFINNTAAVAVFIPLILGLCRRRGASPSRFFMPLSFAAQMGGVCTLIGTSTNILVSDIASRSGLRPFAMFEFTELGLWFCVVGVGYLIVVAPLLLGRGAAPERPRLDARFPMRHYLSELEVPGESEAAGRTIEALGFGEDGEIEILEIVRGGEKRWLPAPDERLAAGDVLLVRGAMDDLLKARKRTGLGFRRELDLSDAKMQKGEALLVEAVVPPGSPLVGRTLVGEQFRRRHRCQALAIRHHDRLERTRVGHVRLSVGDVLLLQGRREDVEALRVGHELLLADEVDPRPRSWLRGVAAVAVLAAVVALAALGVAPIVLTAMAGCVVLVAGRILTVEQAYSAVDTKVIFLLAGVIPLGIALEQSGAAALLSNGMVWLLGGLGPWVLVGAFYLVTTILTEFMSNNAAAALLAPLAIATASQIGVDARPFLVAVTFAASTSFMTPVGYQTNAMVMGPGGYRFVDFTRVGGPLNAIFWILGVFLIPRFFPF